MSNELRPFDLHFCGGPFDGGMVQAQGERLDVAPAWWFHRHLDDPSQAAVYHRGECIDGPVPTWQYEYCATVPVIAA